jgi:hypothetical protein
MRHQTTPCIAIGLLATVVWACSASSVRAQNDWQYPDPYFGILEIEKSQDGATARRSRAEVNPAPRAGKFSVPSWWPAPAGEAAAPPAPHAPAPRPRWRTRWRRY